MTDRPCRVLMVYPRFAADSFWVYTPACEIVGARYPTAPLGMITVAAMLPSDWEVRLVNRNTEDLVDGDLEWADMVMTGGMLFQQADSLRITAMAQALGKPVVATAWSGNVDFMNEHNSALVSYALVPVHDPEGAFQTDNQKWAEANVEEAAQWLRRLAGDADLRARMGAAAAKDVAAQLSPKHFASAVAALIETKDRR